MATLQPGFITNPNPILPDFAAIDRAAMQQQTGLQTLEQNRQTIGANENEYVARVAQSVRALPPDQRPAAYQAGLQHLQRFGLAMNAPAVYDEATVERAAMLGTSSEKLGEQRANLTGNAALVASLTGSRPNPLMGPGASTPVASTPGVSPSYAGGIAAFEGGGNAQPPENPRWPVARGGPAGAHQFIASTWNAFAQANPELFKGMTPEQILAARNDPDLSTKAANWYAGENAKVLQAQNIEPTPGNVGIAHTLGPGGAIKVLSAPDNTPLSQVIPETIAQNPQYGRMTVGDLKRQYSRLGPIAPQQAPGAPGGGRVQVASVTDPTKANDATTAPQQPQQQTTDEAVPPPGQYTAEQMVRIQALAAQPTTTQAKLIELTTKFDDDNRIARQNAQTRQDTLTQRAETRQHQERQDQRADSAEQRAIRAEERLDASAARADAKAAAELEAAQKPYQGSSIEAQDSNILLTGDPSTRQYKGAYDRQAAPKYFPDGSVQTPNMSAYDPPTFKGGGPEGGMTRAPTTPPPVALAGMLENVKSVRIVDQALAELERRKGEGVGLVAGNTPAAILDRTDPDGVTLRALIADIGSLKIHDRSGAAVSASESPRLAPFIPKVSDPPEAIRDKLAKFRREYQAALHDSYEVYGPNGGGRALTPVESMLKGYDPSGGASVPKAGDKPKQRLRYDSTGKVISE